VSSRQEGTLFEVVLPLGGAEDDVGSAARLYTVERPSSVSIESESPSLAAIKRPRVLIIDDELALAKALGRQLLSRYDVDTASTASDALAQLALRPYDAVVCDLRMPDQSGPSIYDATRARSLGQAARFIFITGGSYGETDDELHARAARTGLPLLEKPFDGRSLVTAVERVVQSDNNRNA
jgi:DNA-binding response OmpR family regulator